MRGIWAVKVGMAVAGVLLAGTALAQAPVGGSGSGSGAGAGFGDHRPPFERAMGGDHGRWWNNPKTVDRLKLTDTQRKAMDDTLQQHRSTLIDLRASLEKSELELEPMMKEDQPNESQILAQIDKVAQARAELEKANARFLLQIRSKLTPEQWKQMEADRAARPHGEWGGGPGGPGAGGHGNWQRRQQTPGTDGQAPPPPTPQSMINGGSDAPPAETAGGIQ
jgi:protein CpxP